MDFDCVAFGASNPCVVQGSTVFIEISEQKMSPRMVAP